ncbi:MAG: NAD(P)-dependent oxidoreductase [Oligoflexia bacterium]|nr:NAD(P)-dependent oxidoreductase [Oligoflexia bacterium]
MSSKKIGLIGSGLMGCPMGENWLRHNFVLNVLPHKNLENIRKLTALGANVVKSIHDLVLASDVIVLMLPTSREVEQITDELYKLINKKHIVIDMTTSEPQSTIKIYEKYKTKDFRFFDSPVTGGVKGATEGTLTLFVAGPEEYFVEVKDVLKAISNIQRHFGKIGNGHAAKMINNFICIGNLSVFSEALPLAVKLGIKPKDILETTMSGTAASRMLELYADQILKGDFAPRFKMEHAHKDIQIVKNLVNQLQIELPMLEAVIKDLELAKKEGYFSENISALIRPFENKLHSFFRS